jgi:hypothetical protein
MSRQLVLSRRTERPWGAEPLGANRTHPRTVSRLPEAYRSVRAARGAIFEPSMSAPLASRRHAVTTQSAL